MALTALIFMFKKVQPGFFDPLFTHHAGPWIIGIASILWAASLYIGFKIVRIDT